MIRRGLAGGRGPELASITGEMLAGSLVYDTGFPLAQETAGNPGSNPGGRTIISVPRSATGSAPFQVKAY
jgi:hypothetical protein